MHLAGRRADPEAKGVCRSAATIPMEETGCCPPVYVTWKVLGILHTTHHLYAHSPTMTQGWFPADTPRAWLKQRSNRSRTRT